MENVTKCVLTCLFVLATVQGANLRFRERIRLMRPNHDQASRIIGGEDAYPGEFPFIVSVQDTSQGYPFHFCAGSIYDAQTIITTASCMQGEEEDNPVFLQITAGETDLAVSTGNEQSRKIVRFVRHEAYDEFNLVNDIALLFLEKPLDLNGVVSTIKLPRQGEILDGSFTAIGWGITSEGGAQSDILQKVVLPFVSDALCWEAYPGSIEETMICAGGNGKDACQGDSGGPLIHLDSQVQAGIVSWGKGCGDSSFPGVYTEVAFYVDWINGHTLHNVK